MGRFLVWLKVIVVIFGFPISSHWGLTVMIFSALLRVGWQPHQAVPSGSWNACHRVPCTCAQSASWGSLELALCLQWEWFCFCSPYLNVMRDTRSLTARDHWGRELVEYLSLLHIQEVTSLLSASSWGSEAEGGVRLCSRDPMAGWEAQSNGGSEQTMGNISSLFGWPSSETGFLGRWLMPHACQDSEGNWIMLEL